MYTDQHVNEYIIMYTDSLTQETTIVKTTYLYQDAMTSCTNIAENKAKIFGGEFVFEPSMSYKIIAPGGETIGYVKLIICHLNTSDAYKNCQALKAIFK